MRARYTAFTLGDIEFIMGTHHPTTVKTVDRDHTENWARNSVWQGLEILGTRGGGPGDSEGTVEFVARFSHEDEHQEHHELAHFVRHGGEWIYRDGKMRKGEPVRREEPKVGRNDPCPCGSGKKFKKCCGAA